jgi:hypothetical protein
MASSGDNSPPTATTRTVAPVALTQDLLSESAHPATAPAPSLYVSPLGGGDTSEAIDVSCKIDERKLQATIISGKWLDRLPNNTNRRKKKKGRGGPWKKQLPNEEADALTEAFDKLHYRDTPSPKSTKLPSKKKQTSRSSRWKSCLDESSW